MLLAVTKAWWMSNKSVSFMFKQWQMQQFDIAVIWIIISGNSQAMPFFP